MSALPRTMARLAALLLLPALGCVADASDRPTDTPEIAAQSDALSCPPPRVTPQGRGETLLRPPGYCDPCAHVRCAEGSHCEAQVIVCVRAPCPQPPPVCVPDPKPLPDPDAPFCGGIAAIPCPGTGECVDNPYDNCDPKHGGADCGGLCVCTGDAGCEPDTE